MKHKLLILTTAMIPLLSETAAAADFADLGKIPVVLNLLVLVGAIACLAVAIRLFQLLKGGALAKGCQLWIVSFVALVAGQIFVVADRLQVVVLNFDISGIFYVTTVILWFAGLWQTRRVLG